MVRGVNNDVIAKINFEAKDNLKTNQVFNKVKSTVIINEYRSDLFIN